MFIEQIDATEKKFEDNLTPSHEQFLERDVWDDKITGFKYEYTIDDCCLVRTTDALPVNGFVETPENGYVLVRAYPFGLSFDFLGLLRENNLNPELFKLIQRNRRDTVHFCINGLVSDHMNGIFSGRPFIIIEPLKYHIDSPDLKALRAADTYFKGNVELSNEAVILIRSDVYEQIKDDPNYSEELGRYRIFTYTGEEREATHQVLNKLGYDAFIINDHGYVHGLDRKEPASSVYSFINHCAEEHAISTEPHFYSKSREEVLIKMESELKATTIQLVDIILKELGKSEREIEDYHYLFASNSSLLEDGLINLVTEYGIDNFARLIARINEETLAQIEEEKNALNLS